jgi:hypothetical protein
MGQYFTQAQTESVLLRWGWRRLESVNPPLLSAFQGFDILKSQVGGCGGRYWIQSDRVVFVPMEGVDRQEELSRLLVETLSDIHGLNQFACAHILKSEAVSIEDAGTLHLVDQLTMGGDMMDHSPAHIYLNESGRLQLLAAILELPMDGKRSVELFGESGGQYTLTIHLGESVCKP